MTDEQIEKVKDGVWACLARNCKTCPYHFNGCNDMFADFREYFLSLEKSKTQLREILSALYQRTGEQGFTLYRKDIVEPANDYGIKEEELK